MQSNNIQQQIENLQPWFHNLHLPSGHQTAPHHELGDFPRFKWEQIEPLLPQDLNGLRALDIGCNAGFYSFELARRGAQVLAIDHDSHYLKQALWACKEFDLARTIEFQQQTLYQLNATNQHFDLVMFMGVFYHLRYPLLALDIIRRCCRGQMVFQTLTKPGDDITDVKEDYPLAERSMLSQKGWPTMSFIEKRFANDPTNWWAPDHAAILALLRSSGFCNIRRIAHEIYFCEIDDSYNSIPTDFEAIFKNHSTNE